jgi:hypothetical protein
MRTKPLVGRKAWFGPRRMGWGLSPISTEGWVVTVGAVAVIIAVAAFTGRHNPWTVLPVVVLLLLITFLKGTSPGGSREWQEFQASRNRGDS